MRLASTGLTLAARRGTVSWLVRRCVARRTDITPKAQEQYAWAIPHIENGLGAITLSRLDRDDVTEWIEQLAAGGALSRRSVQICRNVSRAALVDAVDEGLIPRSPAARVGLPRALAKPVKEREVVRVGRARCRPVLDGDRLASLGDWIPPRRPLRAPPQRGAGTALG